MEIKQRKTTPRPVDVKEWNEDVRAFLKPMTGFESLAFNDYFLDFYSREKSDEERFAAAFNAAKMALVDENGAPLLVEDDRAAIRAASFLPLYRIFGAARAEEEGEEVETLKKNS